jgi:hypothetical protein
VTGLLALLLLSSPDAGFPGFPDGGVGAASARSAEDEEVIQNLDLLHYLAESQALELLLDLDEARAKSDH